MPQTQTQPAPQLEWLYDAIMRLVEPELLSANIPLLDEQYQDETAEQHEARMKRYEDAFRRFNEILTNFGDFLYQQSRTVVTQAKHDRAAEEAQEKQRGVANIETIFSDQAPPSA